MPTIDIILPAYYPVAGWEEVVINRFTSLQKALPHSSLGLVIVNDGTPGLDESPALTLLRNAIPHLKWVSYAANRGKGYALREGVRHSRAGILVYTDIDWPYTEGCMIDIIQSLNEQTDVAIGTRDNSYYQNLPKARTRISRLLRWINAKLLGLQVSDTQAGLKGFRASAKDLFLATTIDRYLFDLEFIYRLSGRRELRVHPVPVTLREGIVFSRM